MKEILLQTKDIHVSFGGVKALNGCSVDIDEGEVVALIGPNGAGKSTIIKAIFGLVPLDEGHILWQGEKIKPITHQMVARRISYVPQGRQLFRNLSVFENLEMGGYTIKDLSLRKERIEHVLDIFPMLKSMTHKKASALSGGQQQMLAIARGLMIDPEVLLLDEPSLGLAPKIVKEVFLKIREINERRKTSILIVEHNIKSLLAVSHKVYVLDKGSVVMKGTPQEIEESKILEKVFVTAEFKN